MYSSTRGYTQALGTKPPSSAKTNIAPSTFPQGSPWAPSRPTDTNNESDDRDEASLNGEETGSEDERESCADADEPAAATGTFKTQTVLQADGDAVLANSILFMRDAIMQRAASHAVSLGDMASVFEIYKASEATHIAMLRSHPIPAP